MEDTFYLLANPNYRQKKELYEDSNDRSLLILLNKKFPHINISEDDYNNNIPKIVCWNISTKHYNRNNRRNYPSSY